jgi:hypothetical protein
MRPNELGGQTLENSLENELVINSLSLDGEPDLAHELAERVDRSGKIEGNIIPDLTVNNCHEVIVLEPAEANRVVTMLGKIVNGNLEVETPYQRMLAESMLGRYEGRPTLADIRVAEREKQRKRILPTLKRLILS